MNISKEKILALKISSLLSVLLCVSFGIFIYSNFLLSLSREKTIFVDNLKLVPQPYIKRLIWEEPSRKIWKKHNKRMKIFANIFSNYYIKMWEKVAVKWLFTQKKYYEKIFTILKIEMPQLLELEWEKILFHTIKKHNIVIVVWKNIDYIFDWVKRLVYIACALGVILLWIIYFISVKLAYRITLSDKKARKKLEEYNVNVAHELKTPLTVMKSDLELLKLSETLDIQCINSSLEELDGMQSIIDSLLFLSQKETQCTHGKIDILSEILGVLDSYFSDKSHLFSTEAIIIGANEIYGDTKLFNILLKNIFENALKYWEHSETQLIEVWYAKNILTVKNFISLETQKLFSDNTNSLDILFDSFYQGDNSRYKQGCWLGLNIVKKICKLHNFAIKVEIIGDSFILSIACKN